MSATPVADQAAATFAGIAGQIGLLEVALTASNAERDTALAKFAQAAGDLDRALAEIARLTGAGPVPVPPPVPDPDPLPPPAPAGKMLLGATIDPHSPLTRQQTIDQWIAKCGPLEVARVFISGTPTVANIAAGLAPHIGKRHRVLSYKGEGASNVLASVPADGFTTWLVKYHEPENDGGTHTPAWFKQVQDEEIAQIKALGRKDIKAGFVLMGWVDNDSDPSTTSTAWFPNTKTDVTMFLDPYDIKSNVHLPLYVMNSLSLWRSYAGAAAPWGIAEMGTQRKGAAGAGWITEALTFARAEHAVAACWFHSGVNGIWWLDDPLMQAAWKAQATA